MKKLFVSLLVLALLVFPVSNLTAGKTPMDISYFWGYVYLYSEYMSQGVPQSNGEPSLHTVFGYWNPPWEWGIWAASVDYETQMLEAKKDNRIEWSLYGAYYEDFKIMDFQLDWYFEYDYMVYEGNPRYLKSADYWEFYFDMSHDFSYSPLSPQVGFQVSHSPSYSGDEGRMYGADIYTKLEFPNDYELELRYAYNDWQGGAGWTGDGVNAAGLGGGLGYDYFWWHIGIKTIWKTYNVRLVYTGNSEREWKTVKCPGRFVFSIEFGDYYY